MEDGEEEEDEEDGSGGGEEEVEMSELFLGVMTLADSRERLGERGEEGDGEATGDTELVGER